MLWLGSICMREIWPARSGRLRVALLCLRPDQEERLTDLAARLRHVTYGRTAPVK